MKNALKLFWIIVLAAVIVFSMIGCGSDDDNEDDNNDSQQQGGNTATPLAGTVTVSSAVTVSFNGSETMTLTADTSGLTNGDRAGDSYQWQRDNVDISGARQKTFAVTTADYGKTLKVKVTNSNVWISGEQTGQIVVPSPKTLSLTLKWASNAGKKDTSIIIEREQARDGITSWTTVPSFGNLTTTGTTITLTSWVEEKFKMRTTYTFFDGKFYFKKDNAAGSDLFDFVGGTKTYTLTNTEDQMGALTGLFATEN